MAIQLHGRVLHPLSRVSEAPFVGRICRIPELPIAARTREILLADRWDEHGGGFRACLVRERPEAAPGEPDTYFLGDALDHLEHGDVVRIDPAAGHISVLYRKRSPSNSFLLTERCDNYCIMCSQPPKERDDGWIVDELERDVLPLVSQETAEFGLTGGEPTLLGDRFIGLVDRLKRTLPRTAVHVLSNGRRFADARFARRLANVRHPDLMIGIPLYSARATVHDYVVQARGAYDETVRGILHLKQFGVRVELRFVIHRDTCPGMVELAQFIARNLVFVDHVALMGLELMGFARANLDALWIDPLDYRDELAAAVDVLARAGVPTSIYNHQLCTLPREVHAYSRASISDWKNEYLEPCHACAVRKECGGFFSSSKLRVSRGIQPIENELHHAPSLTTVGDAP